MYRRAISTLGCGELDLAEAGWLALRYGMDAIELRALGGSLDLPAVLAGRYTGPGELTRLLPVRPRPVVAVGSSCRLVGSTDADRADLLNLLPWAEALGVPWVRVFDGGERRYDAAETAEALRTLSWWRERRAAAGWKADLMVETHDSLLTAADISRFAAAAGGLAVLWDAHHTWHKGGEEPRETWAAIGRHVVHVHVKDSVDGRYVLPGSGSFPMAALQPVLAREFTGVVSLEWERWWHPTLPALEEALAAARMACWW